MLLAPDMFYRYSGKLKKHEIRISKSETNPKFECSNDQKKPGSINDSIGANSYETSVDNGVSCRARPPCRAGLNGTEAVHYIGRGFGGSFTLDQTDRIAVSGGAYVKLRHNQSVMPDPGSSPGQALIRDPEVVVFSGFPFRLRSGW